MDTIWIFRQNSDFDKYLAYSKIRFLARIRLSRPHFKSKFHINCLFNLKLIKHNYYLTHSCMFLYIFETISFSSGLNCIPLVNLIGSFSGLSGNSVKLSSFLYLIVLWGPFFLKLRTHFETLWLLIALTPFLGVSGLFLQKLFFRRASYHSTA